MDGQERRQEIRQSQQSQQSEQQIPSDIIEYFPTTKMPSVDQLPTQELVAPAPDEPPADTVAAPVDQLPTQYIAVADQTDLPTVPVDSVTLVGAAAEAMPAIPTIPASAPREMRPSRPLSPMSQPLEMGMTHTIAANGSQATPAQFPQTLAYPPYSPYSPYPSASAQPAPLPMPTMPAPAGSAKSNVGQRITGPMRAHPSLTALILAGLALLIIALPVAHAIAQSRGDIQWQPSSSVPSTSLPGGKPPVGANQWATQTVNAAELNYVNSIIAHMTLQQEVGQMIMIEFEESQMTPGLAYEISHYNVGSVILYAYNVLNTTQMQQFTQAMQANATLPLLISTDQEGGPVNRLYGIDGPLPSAEQIGATNDPNYARQRGEQDGQALYNLGINTNLAPVVDVQNIPDGEGDLGGRMFGTTPQQVTKMAGAYLEGLQEGNHVVGCLKHFPGLGDVPVDPHKQLYSLDRSLDQLRQIDWAPYASLFATGQVGMVMVTHVVIPAVDPTRPATLSKPVITGVLRDQLHFNGVVVTDGIYMKSLSQYSFDQIVLYAVEAGVDIISSTYSLASTAEAERVILDAVQNGTISKQQIDDSVRRILLLKLRYGVLTMPKPAA